MNPFLYQNHKKITSNFNHLDKNQKPKSAREHKRSKSYSRDNKKYSMKQSSNQMNVQNIHFHLQENISKDSKKLKKKNKLAKGQLYQYHGSKEKQQQNNSKQKIKIRPVKSSPNKNSSIEKKKSKQKKRKNSKINKFQTIDQKNLSNNKKQIKKLKKSKQIERSLQKKQSNSRLNEQNQKYHHRRSNSISFNKIKNKEMISSHQNNHNFELNFKNISLNADNEKIKFPYASDFVLKNFKDYLTIEEINQLKQYKQIYYLGKHFKSIIKGTIKSARANINNPSQNDHLVHDTQLISPQRKNTEDDQFYKYEIGDQIAFRYQILSSINQGSFGQVLKVYDHKNKQEQAMKIVRKSKDLIQQTFVQISILTHIKEKDKTNISGIVRIKDFLLFRNHICILFQLLDGNLYQLITSNNFKGFSQQVIRIFAVQLLNSLNFLKREQIIHCDLKPQNLVMKSWGKTGIKIVDFGTSCFEGKQIYTYLQSRYYRAPQIIMQVPYSYPIDMWSFACILAQLRLGQPLFSGRSDLQQLIYITKSLGFPSKKEGLFCLAFLQNSLMKQIIQKDYISYNRKLDLNHQQNEYQKKYNKALKTHCLMDLQERLKKKGKFNIHFLIFLQSILTWQPEKRLTPQEALQHPWIIKGLPQQIKNLYSAFNTISSLQKKKKKSKDSKISSREKSKKSSQKKRQISEKKQKQANKINFAQKNNILKFREEY